SRTAMIGCRFHHEARAELQEAVRYYQGRRQGLGRAFLTEVQRTVSLIRANPGIGAVVGVDIRRRNLQRFPYSVLYSVGEGHITILAVMHQRRRPGYWKGRRA